MLFLLPSSATVPLNRLDLQTTKASSVTTTNYMSCRGNSGTFIDAPSDLKVSQKPWILASYQRRFVRRLTIIRLRDSLSYSPASGTSSKLFGIWKILTLSGHPYRAAISTYAYDSTKVIKTRMSCPASCTEWLRQYAWDQFRPNLPNPQSSGPPSICGRAPVP